MDFHDVKLFAAANQRRASHDQPIASRLKLDADLCDYSGSSCNFVRLYYSGETLHLELDTNIYFFH